MSVVWNIKEVDLEEGAILYDIVYSVEEPGLFQFLSSPYFSLDL
jgi:hypothetical protein